MDARKEIKLKLQTLPEKPGVYQYFDESGKILYVGKAKNLKKRVNSYFTKVHDNNKTNVLVKKIRDIKYIVVKSELDALLLENNLIKELQPRYNILLKDDKTYPWICIKNEHFPRIFSTRNIIKDGSLYFGPYSNVKMMHTLLELFREIFPIRTCSLDLAPKKIKEGKYTVCLEYHIGKCNAPCVGKYLEEEYLQNIEQIKEILKGNTQTAIRFLKEQMTNYANDYRYEEAQKIKEKLFVLEKFQAKSTIVSTTMHKMDIITFLDDGKVGYVNYLMINNGAIVHAITLEVKKNLQTDLEEIILFALMDFRGRYQSDAKEVLCNFPIKTKLEGITFRVPVRGEKKEVIDLSMRNNTYYRLSKLKQEKIIDPERHTNRILAQMKADLRLTELPVHIECFDNSNIQGTNPVSACVVFKNAKPSNKDYRHFIPKTVVGPDDFKTMEEVVYRRYKRMIEEEQPFPNLVVVDGGKGQLSAALKAFEALGIRGKIPIIGIAERLEEIFFPGDSIPLYLDKRSETLKVIQHIRDEAHRFGITHHRDRRSKNAFHSELESIPGIGPKSFQALLHHFKTVSKVKNATQEELAAVIGPAKAKTLLEYFSI